MKQKEDDIWPQKLDLLYFLSNNNENADTLLLFKYSTSVRLGSRTSNNDCVLYIFGTYIVSYVLYRNDCMLYIFGIYVYIVGYVRNTPQPRPIDLPAYITAQYIQ